jgi:hypothetical protein
MKTFTTVFCSLIGGVLLSFATRHGRAWFRELFTGSDGLTDRERTALVEEYLATAGSRALTPDERRVLNLPPKKHETN